jgi:hypothetical protein
MKRGLFFIGLVILSFSIFFFLRNFQNFQICISQTGKLNRELSPEFDATCKRVVDYSNLSIASSILGIACILIGYFLKNDNLSDEFEMT